MGLETCPDAIYVKVKPVHDPEKAKKHHERASDLAHQLVEAYDHEAKHAHDSGSDHDIEKAKAHHEKTHEIEEALLEELMHQKRYREHHKEQIVRFEIMKDYQPD